MYNLSGIQSKIYKDILLIGSNLEETIQDGNKDEKIKGPKESTIVQAEDDLDTFYLLCSSLEISLEDYINFRLVQTL